MHNLTEIAFQVGSVSDMPSWVLFNTCMQYILLGASGARTLPSRRAVRERHQMRKPQNEQLQYEGSVDSVKAVPKIAWELRDVGGSYHGLNNVRPTPSAHVRYHIGGCC